MPNLWLLFNEWRDSLIKGSSNSGRLEPKFFEVQLFILHPKFSNPMMRKVTHSKPAMITMEARTLQPAEQALLHDQPSMKLIFVSCTQKNRIICRSDEVHERERDCFPKFFFGKQPIKNKPYFY